MQIHTNSHQTSRSRLQAREAETVRTEPTGVQALPALQWARCGFRVVRTVAAPPRYLRTKATPSREQEKHDAANTETKTNPHQNIEKLAQPSFFKGGGASVGRRDAEVHARPRLRVSSQVAQIEFHTVLSDRICVRLVLE